MNSVSGVTLRGVEALQVEVEVEIAGGLFSITIVGMPDTAVRESRERVRAALLSMGMGLKGRISVNLAPADIPKEGALLDLPIALGMLQATDNLKERPKGLFMGELALDGRLRKVRGAVPAALLAKKLNVPLYVPSENAPEISLVHGVEAYCADSLSELFMMLTGQEKLKPIPPVYVEDMPVNAEVDFSDIKGQKSAKRAAEIAAAGHHNLLLVGSPGSGKTMIAKAIAGILPPLTDEELVETLLVRSTLGMDMKPGRERPFRTIHFTASTVSVCGGGANLRPGEVSLAHRGVLFLDEYTEFSRDLTESLRAPIEDGAITVSRATGSVVYPARVLLVLATNPCACGYAGDPVIQCRCNSSDLERYNKKLSGPIMDRIDLQIKVPRLTPEELLSFTNKEDIPEASAVIRERVIKARKIQQDRWKPYGYTCNAELPERIVRQLLTPSDDVKEYLTMMAAKMNLSGRGLSRVLKIARTIADLAGDEQIEKKHLNEAIMFRRGKNTE